jgi:hypothetical protein
VRKHRALRPARRAGRVAEERHVVRPPFADLCLDEARVRRTEFRTELHHRGEGPQHVVAVMEHAARVVVDHEPQLRQPRPDRQDLVDLLLVFGDYDLGFCHRQHVAALESEGRQAEREIAR